jgi:hypothetical protein
MWLIPIPPSLTMGDGELPAWAVFGTLIFIAGLIGRMVYEEWRDR